MLVTIVLFLIVLSVLVLAHELGHFFVAKKTGIKVEEFGFGLPPRLLGKKIGETVYSLNLLPIGGFVKLLGEDDPEGVSKKERKRAFFAKSKKVKVATLVAGVLMNFLLAIFCFSVVYSKAGIPTSTDKVRILAVAPSSPAQEAGLRGGDVIVSAAEREIKSTKEFLEITKEHLGKELVLEVEREKDNPCQEKRSSDEVLGEISCRGENLVLWVTPREEYPEGEGPLGVVISQVEMKFYPFLKQIYLGTIEGFKEAFAWLSLVFFALAGMLHRLITAGAVPRDIAGPVGIFQITGEVGKTGFLGVLQFIGILSVNLAVINILPFPALDGGRLLFVGVEILTGRRIKASVERLVHTMGMAFLLFLILLITLNDLARILKPTSLMVKLKELFLF